MLQGLADSLWDAQPRVRLAWEWAPGSKVSTEEKSRSGGSGPSGWATGSLILRLTWIDGRFSG
jgi:hypothetical protein